MNKRTQTAKVVRRETRDRHRDRHTVALPGDLYDRAKALAKDRGQPMVQLVRRLLEQGLEAAQANGPR